MTEVTTGPAAPNRKKPERLCKKLSLPETKADRTAAHKAKMIRKAQRRAALYERIRSDRAYKRDVAKALARSGSQADHPHKREREIARRLRRGEG